MSYTLNRVFDGTDLATIEARTRKALSEHGFGVLTEIDFAATMKKRLNVDVPGYRILGACNPEMAYRAMQLEPQVGAMLPCNVILRELPTGVEVSAIDPVASMQAIENPGLHAVANQVRQLLQRVVDSI